MFMSEITKQDLQDLTAAMVEGFDAMQQRFEEVDATLEQHGKMIDHIAGRVDDLWVEAGAQTEANRRFETRIARIESHLGLTDLEEPIAA